ncbi:MAG: sensor histidine kinase [Ilumatobacter sp.]
MVDAAAHDPDRMPSAIGRLPRVWLVISFISLAFGFVLTFDPSFADAGSTITTLIPFLLLPTMVVAFTKLPAEGPSTAFAYVTLAAVAGWAVLVLDDTRWAGLTFALYGMAFSIRGRAGLAVACAITGIWLLALAANDEPAWLLVVPIGALLMGVFAWRLLARTGEENVELARLVEELRATREDLAASERDKGVLEERARVAGEIHDTLAQGFTSIVMLARSSKRTGSFESGLDDIESVASDNLQAARRLVAAMGPPELDSVALPDAMKRHIETSVTGSLGTHFEVVGEPTSLGGTGDMTLMRALQEALLNVRNHAEAAHVHITLSYLDHCVVLDVVDDGAGFVQGDTADRGDLTGGQGLRAIRHRIEAIGGTFDIETAAGSGTAVSAQIPIGAS